MEIPEPAPNPHGWVLDFCGRCEKCVRSCPPEAIFTTAPVDAVTGRKATVHYKKCLDYFGEHQGCAVCVKVCPFSQAGYDRIQSSFLKAQSRRQTVAEKRTA
jgi:epoxyqueuosine reductase QueG